MSEWQVYRLFEARRGAWSTFQFLVCERLREDGVEVEAGGTLVAPAEPDAQLLVLPADVQPVGTPDAGTFPTCDIRTIPRQCVAFFGPPPCVWLDSLVACRTIEMNCSNGVVCGITRIVVSNCDLCRLLVGP